MAVIGLMHPVAGVYACVFILLYAFTHKATFIKLASVFIFCSFYLVILYLPVIMMNIESWKLNFIQRGFIERTHSFTDISVFLKYASYNPSIVLLIIFTIISAENFYKEIVYWLIVFFVLSYFHQSYYFHYMFAFALWRLSEIPRFKISVFFKVAFAAAFLYGLAISYCLLTFQVAENYAYADTFKKILAYLPMHEVENAGKKVWVPAEISMSIIDKANTRLHWSFIADYKKTMQPADTGSIFYMNQLEQLDYIKKYAFVHNTHLQVSEIFAPVKGLLTISLNGERSASIGLWKAEVVAD